MALVGAVAALAAAAVPTQADQAATQAAVGAIEGRLPAVTRLFVNCPDQNTIAAPDGSTGIGCEWRGLVSGAVRTGSLTVTPAGGGWQAGALYVSPPFPQRWRSCSRRGLSGHDTNQRPVRLAAHGVACSDAKFLARDIGARVLLHNLRVPRHFTESWYGTNSLGFVINTFGCRGKARLHRGDEYMYAHEVARCANRFGDRFVYSFVQGS
ncbi:MAG: hypothetical protein ACJ77M_00790 [Thermoleophilaceae bacterium]